MSIILAQNLVRQGKSVEEAAKIAGVGEDMLRGLLGLPKKEASPINRTKATETSTGDVKKQKIRIDSDAIKRPTEEAKKEQRPKKPKKRNLISELCEKYPRCFNKEEPKPLKIGIHKDILEQQSDMGTSAELSRAIRNYVRSDVYLAARARGGSRYDLEGVESGEVSEEHKEDAVKWIELRQRQKEERKKKAEEEASGKLVDKLESRDKAEGSE